MLNWGAKTEHKLYSLSYFSGTPEKRVFFFFLLGDPVQNCHQNPSPAGCLFSTRQSRFEVPERGDFRGKKIAWGGVGGQGKQGKKNAHGGFLILFRRPPDIPPKSRDIPPKSMCSLGFEGHTELFGSHPFYVEDPHRTRRCPDQKVWVWVPFSSLTLFALF